MVSDMSHVTVDVLIVGGGPAGLATALAARRHNLSVLVADAQSAPIDKTCGEGLMPDGLEALRELGIDTSQLGGYPFSGICFRDEQHCVQADFPKGFGIGIRRAQLHRILVEAAENAGICFRWQTPVHKKDGEYVLLADEQVLPRWIVGADGNSSVVRRWIVTKSKTTSMRIGLRRHYAVQPWSTHVEVHWANGVQAYVTPVEETSVCVVFITSRKDLRFESALTLFPELLERLKDAKTLTVDRGGATLCRTLSKVVQGNIALIGEASGAVDAITGEGMMLAFRQALLLGEAFERGDLSLYQRAHPKLFRRPRLMAHLMLKMSEHAALRRAVLAGFECWPALFQTLLAFHVGSTAPSLTANPSVIDSLRRLGLGATR